ncbi:MAG TPA: anthranilate synthase component I [Bacteroidota bacterium]|nr:anthranilate synthase component I [Bacteroidota bacterium]
MTFEEFKEFAASYNVIPISKRTLADMLTPVSAYLRLREGSASSFLFESVEGGELVARYSFIGRDPIAILKCRNGITTIQEFRQPGPTPVARDSSENFFDIVDNFVGRYRQPHLPSLPRFRGGLVGFIGYDAVRFIEKIPSTVTNEAGLDDSILCLFTSIIVFDHHRHEIVTIVNVLVDGQTGLRGLYERAQEEIRRLESLLQKTPRIQKFHAHTGRLVEETGRDGFVSVVKKAKQYITDGDIFQVVLSRRFTTPIEGDAFNAYRALRVINPSPYLYYLDYNGFKVIGSSPEILVRMENGTAEVYPIAGTRRRGNTEAEDAGLERELLADEKERAEHIMLVDLGRNDLGRVCEIGTVKVDQLMTVVRYSHVMHLASRVTGVVMPGKSCVDVLKAAFPAGTVSGAPKIRAMEIIDELETTRRAIYAGGVGYFDFSGNMDMCIAIRTMFALNGRMYLQAGAGIVADSNPVAEFEETTNKARALVEALRMAEEMAA